MLVEQRLERATGNGKEKKRRKKTTKGMWEDESVMGSIIGDK
jgi:hypothetical protein